MSAATRPEPAAASAFAERYSRQELFAGIGRDGQARLRAARVLVIGCGALGSAACEALVRAGVGTLTLVDRDFVEPSNLQRQSLFDEEDARQGWPKAVAAERRLRCLNSDVRVEGRVADVGPGEIEELVGACDLALDGSDNFELRYLLNDASLKLGRPWIYAAAAGSYGLTFVVRPGATPCLRCVLGERPEPGTGPTCDTVGVIGPIVQAVSALQVAEALKLLTGRTGALQPGLVTLDLWAGTFEVLDTSRQAPSCPACTRRSFEYLDAPRAAAATLCGRDAVQIRALSSARVDLQALERRLAPVGQVTRNDYLLRFHAADADFVVFEDGRAIVKGVRDTAQARSLYARYVGELMANGTTHTLTQIPPGVQCFVGDEARRRRRIEERVTGIFEGWDYEEIIPPLFDYADVFSGAELAARTYSFVGRDGSLLALRPDFTSLLAKVAAGRLANRPAPLRLYYSGEVLRYEPPKAGRQSELFQMGCELMGGERAAADAEVLTIAAECLETAGVRDFVLALGHVGLFAGLVAPLGLAAPSLEALRERIEGKNPEGVREVLAAAGVAAEAAQPLVRLATLAGDAAVLDDARRAFAASPKALAALDELLAIVRALDQAGLGAHLAVDLGEVRGFDYYTGLVFRAYAPSLGFEVGGGGRYDELLARFGRPLPAVGFMLGLDRLMLLLERQGAQTGPVVLPETEEVAGDELGARLRRARLARARGRRVRVVNGGPA